MTPLLKEQLTNLALQLDRTTAEKHAAWVASGFQTGSNGHEEKDMAHRLRILTGKDKPRRKVYQRLAELIQQHESCLESGNKEWRDKSADEIETILKNTAPSGSGIDCGTKLHDSRKDDRKAPKLQFLVEYYHMNDGGYYDGWSSHVITVEPDLAHGFTLSISGRDRNQIKDYLHDIYSQWLKSEVID